MLKLLSKAKLSLIIAGIMLIIQGIILFSGFTIDANIIKKPTSENIIQSLSIGSVLLLLGYFLPKTKEVEYTKCPTCKETFFISKLNNAVCPKCNIKTIDIDKYYEEV